MDLTDYLQKEKSFKALAEQEKQKQKQLLLGLNGSAKAAGIATLYQNKARPILVLTDTVAHVEELVQDLTDLLGQAAVYRFVAEEAVATELAISSNNHVADRVAALTALAEGQNGVFVTNSAAFCRYEPKPMAIQSACLDLQVGQQYDFAGLKSRLVTLGYVNAPQVEQIGQFATRGSIIDLYPADREEPLRLDFFDDELDAMKSFDPVTQKSTGELTSARVLPASDLVMDDDTYEKGKEALEAAFSTYRKEAEGVEKKHITEGFSKTQRALEEGRRDEAILPYLGYFYDEKATIQDYLPDDALVIVDEYARLQESLLTQSGLDQDWFDLQVSNRQLIPPLALRADLSERLSVLGKAQTYFSNLKRGLNQLTFDHLLEWTSRPAKQYFGQLDALFPDLTFAKERGLTWVLLVGSKSQAERLVESLDSRDIQVPIHQKVAQNQVQVVIGNLSAGFEWPMAHLTVLTEKELFAKARKPVARKQKKLQNAERLKSYNELEVGDYVVHLNHGIGQYQGLESLEANGGKQDYLVIAYQKNAKIFLPVTQLNLIQKYIGGSDAGKKPKINKLGGSEWQKTKKQVQEKIDDIADDLLALYAEREAKQGFAFPKDDQAQLKFDTGFPYPETPDQIRSIEEIKVDMQKKRPMDRLLVGDVGFGKTEVALRAVFKAAHAGKQVALLAPTTILVQQHYETLVERFADFPEIRIGHLSRFQTSAENKHTIEALENHELDIVVGTHRLLSKDVAFSDLGLLVIDEEQRFGVKHKERLKQLRSNIDVLTLTATPIPRTLNMAMVGARDLSVIETPPLNRFPIQTYVVELDWTLVRDVIQKELSRNGQVFYLHNRVADLDRIRSQIEDVVPDARVAVIHGQMSEIQLEAILYDFLNGEYDVLVTTTIIETGVDIPNANTLIVDNADHMGLSQLYQLRGRVGRSARLAYAYFTYPFTRTPSEEGEKRLEAIRDFTELGSGFKIAMRDLSLRGAGDLLGKQQHGFIDSVGYDLYTQMLKDAVAKKQGDQPVEETQKTDAELVLGVLAFLPDDYVADNAQKVSLYQQIKKAQSDEDFDQVEDDLTDRFGELPDEAARLILVSRLKNVADLAQATQIRRQKDKVAIRFDEAMSKQLAGETIFMALKDVPYKAVVDGKSKQLAVTLTINLKQESAYWLNAVKDFLAEVLRLTEEKDETNAD
ncbi:transcription-repair coupling factor [Fructobacillus sp. M1-13]|uniref:Transcription-repair-coupling factor n=1 Tax=Fructobacillus papyriferae TaxID=2713171 RepID=A0ABS5QR40_9LACO|nr:transcription-repair coupling factor [Fructobacillus papyriferae]MBS9335595.1 transcription-repair coupling factor [Fructobacillus papyriferae]MCD2159316.1 transcription-repair coupling factor [Fructobacillus papyriferae]